MEFSISLLTLVISLNGFAVVLAINALAKVVNNRHITKLYEEELKRLYGELDKLYDQILDKETHGGKCH